MADGRELDEVKQRLALLEARMQQLFEHLDLRPREGGSWWGGSAEGVADPLQDPEIQDLLAKGNELQAVKRYQQLTGVGLKEAKDAIIRAGIERGRS